MVCSFLVIDHFFHNLSTSFKLKTLTPIASFPDEYDSNDRDLRDKTPWALKATINRDPFRNLSRTLQFGKGREWLLFAQRFGSISG